MHSRRGSNYSFLISGQSDLDEDMASESSVSEAENDLDDVATEECMKSSQ